MKTTFSRGDVTDPIATTFALWAEAHTKLYFDPTFPPRMEWRVSPDIREALIAAAPPGPTPPAAFAERLLGEPLAVDETLPPGWMQIDIDDPGPD